MEPSTIISILAVLVAFLGVLMFLGVGHLRDAIDEAQAEMIKRLEAEADLIQANHAATAARVELDIALEPRTLERFQRQRLLVNAAGGTGYRGVLHQELDDAIVLDAVEVMRRGAGAGADIEAMPGLVVIPAGKIECVQVLRDE